MRAPLMLFTTILEHPVLYYGKSNTPSIYCIYNIFMTLALRSLLGIHTHNIYNKKYLIKFNLMLIIISMHLQFTYDLIQYIS